MIQSKNSLDKTTTNLKPYETPTISVLELSGTSGKTHTTTNEGAAGISSLTVGS